MHTFIVTFWTNREPIVQIEVKAIDEDYLVGFINKFYPDTNYEYTDVTFLKE